MDFGLFFTGILGSAGIFSLIQFFVTRHDRKEDDLKGIKKELDGIKKSLNDTNIRVSRMELLRLIQIDSDNIDAILQVAEYYFIELDGNAYVHAIFEKWAKEHNVGTAWLPKITKGVKYGKKEK